MEKHSVSRLSYLFSHLHLLSSYSFSSTLLSNLSLLSASSLLCFSSVHIVGSLTSKLPSVTTYIGTCFSIMLRPFHWDTIGISDITQGDDTGCPRHRPHHPTDGVILLQQYSGEYKSLIYTCFKHPKDKIRVNSNDRSLERWLVRSVSFYLGITQPQV